MSMLVSKLFPKHLLEKAGLQRYTKETGTTTITIVYDADKETGWLTATTADPIQKDRKDNP